MVFPVPYHQVWKETHALYLGSFSFDWKMVISMNGELGT